jgi:hypothetical protein
MKQVVLMFSLVLFSILVQAQQFTIKGTVVDKNTRKPLPSASVFAQNTTFGTLSDSSGNFKLKLTDGGYDIAVSYTGYEITSQRISNASASENLVIELKPKEKSLGEVSIVATGEVKDGWKKYGTFFTENFIGKTEFAKQAVITNPEVLRFFFSKKRNRLKVIADSPLVVANNALGYNIKYAVDSFMYEYTTSTTAYVSYPLFEEMTGTQAQQQVWKENRKKAYYGSVLHFMRSLYTKTLDDQGFEVQFLVKGGNGEQSIHLKNMYAALNYTKVDSTNTVEFMPNQPDMVVIYRTAKPEAAYLLFDPGAKKDFQVSYLSITPSQAITIENNGYYYDQFDIITNGYWGFQKIANMLPYDYYPEL